MTDTQAVHAPSNTETEPCGDLSIRTMAMPADTNQNGGIFGGWLLSQMDIGGGSFASEITRSRAVTVAVEAMNFGVMNRQKLPEGVKRPRRSKL